MDYILYFDDKGSFNKLRDKACLSNGDEITLVQKQRKTKHIELRIQSNQIKKNELG